MPRIPFADLSADGLRLTAFPAVDAVFRSPEWWQLATGKEPDQIVTNPKKGLVSAEGEFHGGKLVFRSMLDRMDWLYGPSDSSIEAVLLKSEPPTLGPASEAIEAFSQGVERWLGAADMPELTRMAFGGMFVHPMDDRKRAYVQLRDYIPVRIDPESSDILYQINLPSIESKKIEGLRLNRLSKWFVGNFIVQLQNVGGPLMDSPLGLGLRVELDINTVLTFAPIPKDKLVEMYRELVSIGRAVVTEGVGAIDQ